MKQSIGGGLFWHRNISEDIGAVYSKLIALYLKVIYSLFNGD